MEDEAMAKLEYLAESLRHLQVSSCGNVTDEGVLQLKKLKLVFLYNKFSPEEIFI
jgi:H+-transporting ATP synthase F0 complex subunit s